MNKEEIKKDLINILKNQCDNAPFDYCYGCDCDECRARVVTNAGYCKVADDEVVIEKTEYLDLLHARLDEIKMHGEFLDGFNQGYKQAKQDTAREILQMIYDKGEDTAMICLPTIAIKQLAKAYGIKLEDRHE